MRSCIKNALRITCCLTAVLAVSSGVFACGSGGTTGTSTLPSGGNYFDDAIKVGSIGEERDIMNRSSCGVDGHYRKVHVTVVEREGRRYDVVDADCSKGSGSRQFYFDVSSCFPCPD
ncbi:MAG: hypothetical protein WC828_03590 [Thermoleophilia bacterium]